MADKFKILQVGAGGFASRWTNAYSRNPSIELVGLVDIDKDTLDRFLVGQQLQVQGYTEPLRAIADSDAQAVAVIIPPASRTAVVKAAADAGKHIIMEKPLSDSMEDARDMVAYASRKGVKLMVSQNYRSSKIARNVRRVLDSGVIGRLDYIAVDYQITLDFGGGFRHTMRHPLLTEMCIHHFDLVRYLLDDDIEEVTAFTWNPPWSWFAHDPVADVHMVTRKGFRVAYLGSWVSRDNREPSRYGTWRIQGDRGALVWDDVGIRVVMPDSDEAVVLEEVDPVEVGYSLQEFMHAIRDDREPVTNGQDNLLSLGACMAAIRSADEKRTVTMTELLG